MAHKNSSLKIFIFFSLLFLTLFELAFAISPEQLGERVRKVFIFLIQVGVILAFLSLVFGGILYLTSFGEPKRLAFARRQIIGSFLGLLILLTGWYIIKKIRPEFTRIELKPIDVPTEEVRELRNPSGIYFALGEIPIETFLKGKEGIDSRLFNKKLLEDILKLLENLKPEKGEGLLDLLLKGAQKVVELMHQCTCEILKPEGIRISYCFPLRLLCVGRCWMVNGRCCGDPCARVRIALIGTILENKNLSMQIFTVRTEIEKRIHLLSKILAEIYYLLGTMEKCPYTLTFNRDYHTRFIDQLKKQAPDLKWEISRIPLLKEIDILRTWSFADFYCPKTGVFLAHPKSEEVQETISSLQRELKKAEMSQEEKEELKKLEEFSKKMEKELSPEYELPLSCPLSIPFGESIEKLLRKPNTIRNNLRKITEKLVELINKLLEIHQASFKCSARNCKPKCRCAGSGEECDCVCKCVGEPCPLAEAERALSEFIEIYNELVKLITETREIIKYILEKWLPQWEKIEKDVREKERPLTLNEIEALYQAYPEAQELVTFELVSAKYHYCLAQVKEVEAEFRTTHCETALLSLNPENRKIATTTDCMCERIGKECQVNLPIANYSCEYFKTEDLYYVAPWLPEILQLLKTTIEKECYYFNSFCCRYEKPPVKPQ